VVAVAVQAGVILWRGSALVRSDAGPGGDLRVALAWTVAGMAAGWLAERRAAPGLALWLGTGLWLLLAALVWLQALAGKPLMV
jgi:hypothetical protein